MLKSILERKNYIPPIFPPIREEIDKTYIDIYWDLVDLYFAKRLRISYAEFCRKPKTANQLLCSIDFFEPQKTNWRELIGILKDNKADLIKELREERNKDFEREEIKRQKLL